MAEKGDPFLAKGTLLWVKFEAGLFETVKDQGQIPQVFFESLSRDNYVIEIHQTAIPLEASKYGIH